MSKQFNHMFDFTFCVITSEPDPEKIDWSTLKSGVIDRLNVLDREPSERAESFGICDSYIESEDDDE